ncbi:YcxB family protein [Sphingorhabdus sp.]|uniref:YcxB family protein n=1 Tax=Sphingorhabdus sp. TaxID=1902408 RepID=UPI0032B86E64
MNEIQFEVREYDLVAAQRLYQLGGIKRYAMIMGIVVVAFLSLVFAMDEGFDLGAMTFTFGAMFAVIVLLPILSRYWSIPRMARKALKHDKNLREPTSFRWDSETASMASDTANWTQPIADFAAWRADENVILLYRQTHLYHFIPTRAFSDAATRQSLIDALVANGVSNKWPPK